ncbi:MAG: MarR family transcriptional regulator [Acidobacteria bacterium]|nr:MarR family transcriptional regulator [Acidobacteriota bacterium]MBI3488178.1 MarR family transcriptional regulator [Acidobacteriota bacterium]
MSESTKQMREGLSHSGGESHLLREIVRTQQVLMATFSREVGLPMARLGLMRLLAVSDRDLGVMDLARLLNINAAAVTRQVRELEREGLATRSTDARDGRRSHITLSKKGAILFSKFHNRSHQLEAALARQLNPDELAATIRVLGQLREFLGGSLSEPGFAP